ncbi:MAG TPA: hypothetical protein VHX12_11285 [Acidisoma sp.]|jgi:hypothetical protein|nr:hypothetical protein [Acidisoma sp.]
MRQWKQVLILVGALFAAGSLSACGCGPFGMHYCGGHGWHGGGPGGEPGHYGP